GGDRPHVSWSKIADGHRSAALRDGGDTVERERAAIDDGERAALGGDTDVGEKVLEDGEFGLRPGLFVPETAHVVGLIGGERIVQLTAWDWLRPVVVRLEHECADRPRALEALPLLAQADAAKFRRRRLVERNEAAELGRVEGPVEGADHRKCLHPVGWAGVE